MRYTALYAARRHPRLLHWIVRFGGLGLFFVSFVDSSIIPLPVPGSTDLLLILLVARRASAFWMAVLAILGSVAGGYFTWGTGEKGGEAALRRHLSGRSEERVTGWVKQHGAVAVAISGLLPPPIPHMPFVLAAGAMGVSRGRFLFAYTVSRSIRYSLVAWAGVVYGRRLEDLWTDYLSTWGPTILWAFVGAIICGAIYGVWQFRRDRHIPEGNTPSA